MHHFIRLVTGTDYEQLKSFLSCSLGTPTHWSSRNILPHPITLPASGSPGWDGDEHEKSMCGTRHTVDWIQVWEQYRQFTKDPCMEHLLYEPQTLLQATALAAGTKLVPRW